MTGRCEQSQDGVLCAEGARARSMTHQGQEQMGGVLKPGAKGEGDRKLVQINFWVQNVIFLFLNPLVHSCRGWLASYFIVSVANTSVIVGLPGT